VLIAGMPKHDLAFIVYEGSHESTRVSWEDAERMIIGRRRDADLRVKEPTMSSRHAELVALDDGVHVRDLNSLNGTYVNGSRVADALLKPGDRIQIGRATILVTRAGNLSGPFEAPKPLPSAPTPPPTSVADLVGSGGETLRVSLEDLRGRHDAPPLEEDSRILLLRDLSESLAPTDRKSQVFEQVRRVFEQAFPDARIFILRPAADGDWADDRRDDCPSLTVAAEAARSRSAVLSTSMPQDERFASADSVRISGIQTAIAAPASCDGTVEAVIYVDRLGLPAFSKRDLHLLGIAANHVSAVLENAARIRQLEQAQAQLAELNRELEARVEARTAEVRRQAEEIGRLAEAKDELLGIAAHDIRGPLTVIQGTTELLQLRLDDLDGDTLRSSLALIHAEAKSLGRLLSELLDAKAIESGKLRVAKRPIGARELLDGALPAARLAARHKGIELVVEAPDDLGINADPRRLRQAITNLVLNAIKFSEPGTAIRLEARPAADGGAAITVADQGVGIPEDELDRLFDPYEQGRAGKRLGGGSGLGLMIAKRLVELHGGRLAVSSQVGAGTRFVLSLPG